MVEPGGGGPIVGHAPNSETRFNEEGMHCRRFFLSFFQVTTQLKYIEDSEPVVDGSCNRWCAVQ